MTLLLAGCIIVKTFKCSVSVSLTQGIQYVVTVVVHSPQSGTAGKRQFTLPDCALAMLEQLERAGRTITQAQADGHDALRVSFSLKGKTARVEVGALFE